MTPNHRSPLRAVCFLTAACLISGRLVAASQQSSPPLLERPATGYGSAKIVSVALRQEAKIYKTTAQGELTIHLLYPPGWKAQDHRPAMVFFFGGGWKNGRPVQFLPEAEYFASRGLVCALADYRVQSRQGATPDVCLRDAKSAIRWLRAHAGELGVDPRRVVGSGGSAGAHLAAATALVGGIDEEKEENPGFPCEPNALVLLNPALDLTGLPVKDSISASLAIALSPTFGLKENAPPTILLYGELDPLLQQGREFLAKAKQLKNRCELFVAPGQKHGFFNTSPWLERTVTQADVFLRELGYLEGEPAVVATGPAFKADESPR